MLFDLDGTLADTAPDLALALNRTLEHFGQPTLPFEAIRPVVSHGGMALIRRGFAMEPDEEGFEERRQYLLDQYLDNICAQTRLFPGMDQVVRQLCQKEIPWGIVTNKPAWLTNPLMAALPMPCTTEVIISGDTLPQRKPHPAPLLLAAQQLDLAPGHCLYVGDAERDIEAGRAAGMSTACALFGYLQEQDRPEDWQADFRLQRPEELLRLLPG
ncbi:phosphoglycolate phosphatase [Thiolapillus brandeum]|uniref:phosphoglycolate phosphatase n=2 Tax=Thiolapillus brandeum TaxID=1076588 RepID=A0A7U6GK28_9GAMM|nr:phosphoglycolate phosphatase [Thiolapillus brandeum]